MAQRTTGEHLLPGVAEIARFQALQHAHRQTQGLAALLEAHTARFARRSQTLAEIFGADTRCFDRDIFRA